ncbi:BnaA08g20410D [Brassica napus]|uniref:BnaA08g20410D protein n=1 Tax=Brassica napus TaxID=3708 RepID=A0A078HVQ4_BRANA|nr:BnaA08g20410D [Brassica napus]
MIWVRCTSYTSSLLFSFMQFDGRYISSLTILFRCNTYCCGSVWRSRLLFLKSAKLFPNVPDCSALNLLASKAFDLPHPTKGRSSSQSERLRDHGEEGTNAVSYEPAADKTRHQGETLR